MYDILESEKDKYYDMLLCLLVLIPLWIVDIEMKQSLLGSFSERIPSFLLPTVDFLGMVLLLVYSVSFNMLRS